MKESNSPKTKLTRRGVAAVAGLSMLATAGAANIANNALEGKRINDSQPTCSIPVEYGDTITGIKAELKDLGDDVTSSRVEVVAVEDGHIRNVNDDPRFYVNGSMALKAGDSVVLPHVDPKVCVQAGGVALSSKTTES